MKKYKIYTLPNHPAYKNAWCVSYSRGSWTCTKHIWKRFTRDKKLCRIGDYDYDKDDILKENHEISWFKTNGAIAIKTMEALRKTKVFN